MTDAPVPKLGSRLPGPHYVTLTYVHVTYIVHMPRKEYNNDNLKSRSGDKSIAAEGLEHAKLTGERADGASRALKVTVRVK